MARIAAVTGRFRNRHAEKMFDVDGIIDAQPLGNGYFDGWFERNTLRYRNGHVTMEREVGLWGYVESAESYFRLDIVTADPERFVPYIGYDSLWFADRTNGVTLRAPLETTSDRRAVPKRYGFDFSSRNRINVYEEYRSNGRHWSGRHVTASWPLLTKHRK